MRSGISAGWEGEAPCRRSFGFDNWEGASQRLGNVAVGRALGGRG
jgi:hypothetical protein